MKSTQKELIQELYDIEKNLLGILELLANAIELLDTQNDNETTTNQFEEFCVKIGLIQTRNGFLRTLTKIEQNGISIDQSLTYPYKASIATERKKLDLIHEGLNNVLDLLED